MDRVDDFLTMTVEDAREADKQSHLDIADPRRPIYRWIAAHSIDRERKNYESGDKTAILAAIAECARVDFVMPDWLAKAFRSAYSKVNGYKVSSWDDVFGKHLKKRQRIEAARRKRELAPQVYIHVNDILQNESDVAIDDYLFERVGEKLGIGKTLASKLWYSSPLREENMPEMLKTTLNALLADFRVKSS